MNCKTTFSPETSRRAIGCRAHAVGLALALALNACATVEPAADSGETPEIPPAAIPVAPELYMLPMGTDETGCAVFQPWSPTLAVVQALHWRTAEGSFTLDRGAADCAGDGGS
jgi:hypothetical protein